MRRTIIIVTVLIVLIAIAITIYSFLRPKATPPATQPEPIVSEPAAPSLNLKQIFDNAVN
ncbi:hypothetical protein HYZ64_00865, partial [Candidatus Berkelbacteria bacterium]|nr:hypothetical protein [Candidatus Berkelbacteria bacterium]